jgi:hypothetical protein
MLLVTLYSSLISLSLTVEPSAFTYHGIVKDADLQSIRKHGTTLDNEGRFTYHKGFGITVRSRRMQFTGIYFKNSVNRDAGAVMAGPQLDFARYFTLGLVAGAYMREAMPMVKIPFSYKTHSFEIAPMLMVTASVSIKIYKTLFFELAAGSNYALNFFTPGIRVEI